jgi:hypothetical protein
VLIAWSPLALAAPFLDSEFDARGESVDYIGIYCRYGAVAGIFLACLFVANTAFNNLGFPMVAMAFRGTGRSWGQFRS